MRNYSKKKNYCLIAALASLVAFSTMAASVMSGCGENSDEQKTTEIVHETRIDTQIETKIEKYTEVVTDAQGNTKYVEETKAVPVNNNAGGNSKSGDSGNNSENSGGSSGRQLPATTNTGQHFMSRACPDGTGLCEDGLFHRRWRRGDVLQCKKAGGNRCGKH